MSTVFKYSFDGTAYVCPTTGPAVTGATGTWVKVNDLLGQLTISDVTDTVVEFTISGVAGTTTSYTTYWDAFIESSGTVGSPAVAWDVRESTLNYSFNSNGNAYDALFVDGMGCVYYKVGAVHTMVYNAITDEWASPNYRTVVSTVDPDTVFANEWAAFYTSNTNGVTPVPHTVQWNFIMYSDGLDSEAPDYWDVSGGYVAVSFRSNNVQYARISVDSEGSIFYVTAQGVNTCVYDYISGWVLPAYRTIVCASDPALEFLDEWSNFYTANTVETRWRTNLDREGDEQGPLQWDIRGKSLVLNFSSNGHNYTQINGSPDPECSVYYNNTMAYDYADGFVNEGY